MEKKDIMQLINKAKRKSQSQVIAISDNCYREMGVLKKITESKITLTRGGKATSITWKIDRIRYIRIFNSKEISSVITGLMEIIKSNFKGGKLSEDDLYELENRMQGLEAKIGWKTL